MDRTNTRTKGIACIIVAAFFFSLMTVMVHLAGELPTMQKTLFRNLVAAVIAWIMLFAERQPIRIRRADLPDLLMRSICGTLGMICNFYAIDRLNISDATREKRCDRTDRGHVFLDIFNAVLSAVFPIQL